MSKLLYNVRICAYIPSLISVSALVSMVRHQSSEIDAPDVQIIQTAVTFEKPDEVGVRMGTNDSPSPCMSVNGSS